jgi:hypothetical protein
MSRRGSVVDRDGEAPVAARSGNVAVHQHGRLDEATTSLDALGELRREDEIAAAVPEQVLVELTYQPHGRSLFVDRGLAEYRPTRRSDEPSCSLARLIDLLEPTR